MSKSRLLALLLAGLFLFAGCGSSEEEDAEDTEKVVEYHENLTDYDDLSGMFAQLKKQPDPYPFILAISPPSGWL